MELLTAFLNIEEFYRRIYWSVPTAITIQTEHYTLSYSGLRWLNSANQFWYHMPLHYDAAQLREVEKFYQHYDADFTINFTEPLMPTVGQWLSEHGYRERASSPIMLLDRRPMLTHASELVEVHRVRDAEGHTDLLHLMYDVFFVGPEVSRCIVQPEHLLPDSPMRHYVAYVEGQPAACGSVSLSHDLAGLWSIGTSRNFRNMGVATTLVGYILREATQLGYTTSILLASPMGRPLYESMGYRVIGDAVQYGPPTLW
jgi:GNAT superfamily N-acetyltransferase